MLSQSEPLQSLPQTMLSASVLPQTMLSSSPLPHTMLSSPSELPHTMLSSSALPHTMLLPQTMLSHEGSGQLSPHTMLLPLGVLAPPHSTSAAQAVPPRVRTPPRARLLPQKICLLQPRFIGYASPGLAMAKNSASCTAPREFRKPVPCVSGS